MGFPPRTMSGMAHPSCSIALAILADLHYRQAWRRRSFYRDDGSLWSKEREHDNNVLLRPIGRVESGLLDLAQAPKQADEGAPEASLVIDEAFAAGLSGLKAGDDLIVMTWLDRADRTILFNHPRGDASRPVAGVFTTRSPHRPNPLGVHQVTVAAVDGTRVRVHSLEAIDGTPILDIKGVFNPDVQRR